jgi:hypothetical protein
MAEWVALEVAQLIERGLQFGVEEKSRIFLEASGAGCRAGVLGLAIVARAGDIRKALDRWTLVANGSPSRRIEAAAELLGIPIALARMLELNHRNGVSAALIARGMRAGTLGMTMTSTVPLRAAAA